MGTWDTSLYGGDLPLDIKDEYYEQLYEGHTPEEAAALSGRSCGWARKISLYSG